LATGSQDVPGFGWEKGTLRLSDFLGEGARRRVLLVPIDGSFQGAEGKEHGGTINGLP